MIQDVGTSLAPSQNKLVTLLSARTCGEIYQHAELWLPWPEDVSGESNVHHLGMFVVTFGIVKKSESV